MKNKNKIKLINCIGCTNFCENQNKNKLIEMLREIEKQGFEEIIFCCEALNGSIKEIASELSAKLGFKNSKGKIIWT